MLGWVLGAFCTVWPASLPRQIEAAAAAAGIPVELLAATVGAESTCDNRRVSREGAIGYGQILPGGSAAKGHSARALRRARLNLRLAAEHLKWCLRLCGGDWGPAVAVYSGIRHCSETRWSRRVVAAAKRGPNDQ